MENKAQDAIREEMAVYQKLREFKKTPGFQDYAEWLARSAASQMILAFTSENSVSERVQGEVRAKLHTLQEVGGADLIEQQLVEQLKQYVNPEA